MEDVHHDLRRSDVDEFDDESEQDDDEDVVVREDPGAREGGGENSDGGDAREDERNNGGKENACGSSNGSEMKLKCGDFETAWEDTKPDEKNDQPSNNYSKEGKEPNEDENRLDTCDSTQDPNNVKCVKTLGRSITGDNEKVNIARKCEGSIKMILEKERKNKKRKVDDEGEFVAVTDGFKEGLSRIRSKGGESNGVQASDMDVYTTSNTKEVAKEGTKHMESGSIHEDSVLGWEILLELMSLRVLEQRLELCGKITTLNIRGSGNEHKKGDFNEVRNQEDRINIQFQEKEADDFNDFITTTALIEIPLGVETVIALDRKESDHCPIVLKDISVDFGSKPFRVFDILLEDPDMEKIIVEAWGKISANDTSRLEALFSESEVCEAVKGCESDKAHGPDGFNFKFLKRFWGVIKEDTPDPIGLADFRLISLIGSYYKILAKMLAMKVKNVVGNVIGEVQNAFIGGRYILDGVLIANKMVNYLRKNKKKGLVFIVDFEKAYDSLRWEFLLDVMRQVGFGYRWCNWIKDCLKSPSVFVLVNGLPTNEFLIERGVRQRDPLSPFLFYISDDLK
ncbi:RNA-directed DNA polymerase, eukaryota [Tanacetum coccineum]